MLGVRPAAYRLPESVTFLSDAISAACSADGQSWKNRRVLEPCAAFRDPDLASPLPPVPVGLLPELTRCASSASPCGVAYFSVSAFG